MPADGVNINNIGNLDLVAATTGVPAVLSTALHVNIRVTEDWSGWSGLFILPGDPDYDDGTGTGDPELDNSKVKRWFKNHGVEKLDTAGEHPRSGRSDMRWWRWSKIGPVEWVDVTIDEPQQQRRIWLGDSF